MISNFEKDINLNNTPAVFFSKKKIIAFIIWGILLFVIAVLVVRFVLNLNFETLFQNLIKGAKTQKYFWLVIFFVVLYNLYNLLTRFIVFKMYFAKELKKIPFSSWVVFMILTVFIQIITPFSFGSEPYSFWWLKKHGVSTQKAAAVLAIQNTAWSIGQVLVTWPAFIIFSVQFSDKITFDANSYAYWLVLIGLIVDICMALFVFAFSYSRHIHIVISTITNKVRKLFKMKHLIAAEIRQKYLTNKEFKKLYAATFKTKQTFFTIIISIILPLATYGLFVASYYAVSEPNEKFDSWTFFNISNIASTANNFVPIPNTEGTLQYSVKSLVIMTDLKVDMTKLNGAIFLWRSFTSYIIFFIGLATIAILGLKILYKHIKQHKAKKTNSLI